MSRGPNGNHGPDLPSRSIVTAANSTRPKGCQGKVRYPGRKQALGGLNTLRANDPHDPDSDLLVAYKCPHGCHGWHVGHDWKLRRG